MANRTDHAAILTPDQVADLVIVPVTRDSIAAQTATIHDTATSELRIPRVTKDPTAAWVEEGSEIAVTDATVDEITITHHKLAALSVVSSELANDSSPAASEVIGAGIVRDLVRQLDAAYFGNLTAPAPAGLGALTGTATVTAGTTLSSLDPFAEAASLAADKGATIDTWVVNPADALTLATLKVQTGSNLALLAPTGDPTAAARRVIEGAPVLVTPAVPAGTMWGIPRAAAALSIRQDAEVTADTSAFFTSDRVALRGILRAGIGFPNPGAIVKISIGG